MVDWGRARELFDAAADLAPAERGAFLDEACAGEDVLRASVERLLAADSTPGTSAIDEPLPALPLLAGELAFAELAAGARVGSYRVRSVLGAGGMGTVFLAEQDQPRRTVALKIMRAGITSEGARRRFELESEVLGGLAHPGVAQVFEAGTHVDPASGQELPYFAMEYVDGGRTLDQFVADEAPDLRRTLELFVAMCDAVHHGHQHGVLHRDLKPANVLVDQHGRPKVIDFGIARATGDAGARPALTESGQVLGTLAYMAPERLDRGAKAADARGDVYSLGVILYELLTGALPFGAGAEPFDVFVARMQGRDPERPSRVRQDLPHDLDWIVLRALAQIPSERYPSVSELAADVGRFLTDRPVLAGPPSTMYALRKFVRRHRVLVVAAAVVLAALALGAGAAAVGWLRARDAERLAVARAVEAEREAATQRAVTSYLQSMIRAARDDRDGREVRVVELLERAEAEIGRLYGVRPEVALALRETVATTFLTLGMADVARERLEQMLPDARARLGPQHATTLSAEHSYGAALNQLGDWQGAEEVLRGALAARRSVHGEDSEEVAFTRQCLGAALRVQGRFAEAEVELRAARESLARLLGDDAHDTLATALSVVHVLRERGDLEAAEAEARPLLARAEAAVGADAALTNGVRSTLAQVLRDRGRAREAEPLLRAVLDGARRVYGDHSAAAAGAWNDLAVVLQDQGDFPGAEACLRARLDAREGLTEQPIEDLIARSNLAVILERQDKLDEAEREFGTVLAQAALLLPEGHWLIGVFRKGHGVCLHKRGELAAAERELLAGLELLSRAFADDDRRVRSVLKAVVELYEGSGRTPAADALRARLR